MSVPLDWRRLVAVHPAADRFPMLSEAELKELAADIDANGVRVPLALWRETPTSQLYLIDGRNRVAAMALLAEGGLRIEAALALAKDGERVYEGWPPPLELVASLNLHRRHLTADQKREIAAALFKADPTRSNRAIAALARVDDKTAGNVRKELEGRAEIPHVSTRTDTAGRQQPAHKPPMHRQPPAAIVHNTTPRPAAPVSKEQQLRELREHPRTHAAVVSNTAAPLLLARQIEDFCSGLKGRRTDVERIEKPLRLRLARGLVVALGIDPAELAPASAGGGGAP